MIKIESVHIEEVRGIRKLDLGLGGRTFAISGPNGSGKSGVIDAIEFGLTGHIGRLTGRGTKGLSVAEHGPHVDKVKFRDAAFVRLRVFLPAIGKSATITRMLSAPKRPTIEPAEEDVKQALEDVANHPEITLSRREILRFILVEPTKRSEEIQAILKLEDIGQIRSALGTAHNKLENAREAAGKALESCRGILQRHLQIATARKTDLLGAVNIRRKLLGLPDILDLTADTSLDAGLAASANAPAFNLATARRDLSAIMEVVENSTDKGKPEESFILAELGRLDDDPALATALRQRSFIARGLGLIDGPGCPLCDLVWQSQQKLIDHLRAKLAKSEEAGKIEKSLLSKGAVLASKAAGVLSLFVPVLKAAEIEGQLELCELLGSWKIGLENLKKAVETIDGILTLKDRFSGGCLRAPDGLQVACGSFEERLAKKPDQTASLDAQTFLNTAQLRLGDYREASRQKKASEIAYESARSAYDRYCRVSEDELNALYQGVEKDFSLFYRAINGDDEATFTARLIPEEGSLGLEVNFYDRGLFPPVAYHSEGHQDGMGVCLYLALMKHLFANAFTLALLDDVVMSVDAGHRYEFCKLLKEHFPDTQFVITTHDRLWAEQMKSAGLVTGRTSIAFYGWSIESGPLVETSEGIWQECENALGKNKVPEAAAALRRHLEYMSWQLADQLSAATPFRADGNYELGDLLPPVLKRMKDLYARASNAAQSWGDKDAQESLALAKEKFSECAQRSGVEQWAVNRAVHYNEWANFNKSDFEPVVAAFKDLLQCFRCVECSSLVYVTPRTRSEVLRCACNKIALNLKEKG